MSFFDSFKEEAKQRKKDKIEADIFVEEQKERIRRERAAAREERSIIRKKIKFVDKIASDREEKADLRKIEEIKDKQAEKLKRLRAERSARTGHINRNKIILMVGICIAILAGAGTVTHVIQTNNLEKEYSAAVDCILQEDYQSAIDRLEELEPINDSDALLAYSKCQSAIESYEGEPSEFEKELTKTGSIDETGVLEQKRNALSEVAVAKEAQQNINRIKYDGDINDTKAALKAVDDKVSALEKRYVILVDMTKYEQYESAVKNIEQKTQIGKTILAIDAVGEVELDSKDKIDNARKMYEGLSDSEKEIVVNIGTLQNAERILTALENEKKRKEEAAKKAEEEKSNGETLIADADIGEDTGSSRSVNSDEDIIVYRTNTGSKYHESGCRHLKSKIEITLAQAKRLGLEPCGTCHPPQ